MPLRILLFTALLTLPAAHADDAKSILAQAVAAQGGVKRGDVADIHLSFRGQLVQKGRDNGAQRDYYYRAKDRAFRILTVANATSTERSERGVLGAGYWERSGKTIVALSRGNIDHREIIQAILEDRRQFERILKMVLLTRLDAADVKLLGKPQSIEVDSPDSATSILGDAEARKQRRYHLLEVNRKNQARLVLFVRTDDFSVRKAVQYSTEDPKRAEYWYYFGPYRKRTDGMTLPLYFNIHKALPVDAKTRKASRYVRGTITLKLNPGLADSVFLPTGP
ncbi:MAG: hypothetical protein ACYTGN_06265 [Planctomycetota bacterium]